MLVAAAEACFFHSSISFSHSSDLDFHSIEGKVIYLNKRKKMNKNNIEHSETSQDTSAKSQSLTDLGIILHDSHLSQDSIRSYHVQSNYSDLIE